MSGDSQLDRIAGMEMWYLKGHNGLHRIASSTQGEHEMKCGATLEVIFRGRLVIRPAK
jgi:hypothetical protein